MPKFCHIWSTSKFSRLNESQKYCVVWEELSGVESRIILDSVVEGDEETFEVLKNCTVQPLSPGSRTGIPQPDINTFMEILKKSECQFRMPCITLVTKIGSHLIVWLGEVV